MSSVSTQSVVFTELQTRDKTSRRTYNIVKNRTKKVIIYLRDVKQLQRRSLHIKIPLFLLI